MHLTDPDITAVGDPAAEIRVYIGNRPDTELAHLTPGIAPLMAGDIYRIGQACGNGWRKVFNVYAKLLFALPVSAGFRKAEPRWQQFRDNHLLQAHSKTALWFSEPEHYDDNALHIITGKAYANSLSVAPELHWVTPDFAMNTDRNIVVCPYFDYRQLSNSKILFLVDLLIEHQYLQRLSGKSSG